MSEQPFDESIRSALERIRPEYDPSHWDRMARRLDAQEVIGTDEALDATVEASLSGYRPPYEGGRWEDLRRTLDYRAWRKTYFISKLSESLLLLLLCITVLHFAKPFPEESEQKRTVDKTTATVVPFEGFPGQYASSGTRQRPPAGKKNTAYDLDTYESTHPFVENRSSIPSTEQAGPIEASDAGNRFDAIDPLRDLSKFDEATHSPLRKGLFFRRPGNRSLHPPGKQSMKEDLTGPFISLMNRVTYVRLTDRPNSLMQPPLIEDKHLNSSTWVSGYVSADLNVIHTPHDHFYGLEGYTRTSTGFGFGLAVEWVHDDWVLGTGISFGRKEYQPRRISEIQDDPNSAARYEVHSLDRIGFRMLGLPISMRKYLYRAGRWNVYAGGSMQLHLITHSDYRRIEYPYNRDIETLPQPAFYTGSGSLTLDKKPSPEGLLEGGSFFSSSYFSFDLFGGIEYELRSGCRLFAQPMYIHSMINSGIGPNQDRIQTVTFRFGLRSALD